MGGAGHGALLSRGLLFGIMTSTAFSFKGAHKNAKVLWAVLLISSVHLILQHQMCQALQFSSPDLFSRAEMVDLCLCSSSTRHIQRLSQLGSKPR